MKKNPRFVLIALLVATMTLPVARIARAADKDDEKFCRDAAEWVLGEIELCRLAKDQSKVDGVQHYAELQINGYRTILDEVRTVGQDHKWKLPEQMGPKQKDAHDHLRKMNAHEFDLAFMKDQCDQQKALLDLFEWGQKNTSDKKLKALIERMHPSVREHYQSAVDLFEKVKQLN